MPTPMKCDSRKVCNALNELVDQISAAAPSQADLPALRRAKDLLCRLPRQTCVGAVDERSHQAQMGMPDDQITGSD